MPTRETPWPAGTPNWIDIGVDDIEAAVTFYTELFGWDVPEGKEETGGYRTATLNGYPVAGLSPKMEPNENTYWNNYFATRDADMTAKRIVDAGGQIVVEPMDVMNFGRMAVAVDTNGSPFSIWQAIDHIGCGIYNEPGAFIWNENLSSDPAQAKSFYTKVFDYTIVSSDAMKVAGNVYNLVVLQGVDAAPENAVAGLGDSEQMGGGNYWLTWFASADVDASSAQVEKLGGKIIAPPFDTPIGRMVVVQGNNSEVFGMLEVSN